MYSMSWWRSRRRRSIFDRLFEDFFSEIDEFMREFEREFEELMTRATMVPEKPSQPIVYGFRITIGPDGKPVIEEFGNVRRMRGRPIISEEREPPVDVFEENNQVVVIAEIPGVDKEKIDVRATEDKLVIKASNERRKYYKEVELPVKVKPETAKASYRNGILEVRIEKKEVKREEKEEGIKVKVE